MRSKLILICLMVLNCNALFSQKIVHTEILGRPTDKSIIVQTFFDSDIEASIQYGKKRGEYSNQTNWVSALKDEHLEVLLDNLEPDTKYYYRLNYRLPKSSTFTSRPEFYFHTQRKVSSSFSFVVQADPHMDSSSNSQLYSICLQNQLDDSPDFMIDLGDILMSDKLTNASKKVTHDTVTYRSHLMRTYYEISSHSVPLFLALGNHEGEAGWYQNGTSENVAIWGTLDRKKYFPNPYPDNFYTGDTTNYKFVGIRQSYYAWTWGDALFIVLDPYWFTTPKPDSLNGWRWTLGKTQYDWLKTTLETSKSKFKFVFAHQIIGGDPQGRGGTEYANKYEWGGENLDGSAGFTKNRPGWYKPIKELLAENRVSIFFHGHDHFFGKQEKNCLIYQETPQPSLPNFQNANWAKEYGYLEGQILPNAGHLRVNVSSDGVKVDYVRAYLPKNENGSRHNKDVSATYFIGKVNCYDSLSTGVPVLWNSNYIDELVYPNPFEVQTKIEFVLNKSEKTSLFIYNEIGRMVRALIVDSFVNEGKFQIYWDGKDAYGSELPKGSYMYVLKSESSEKTGKIILNK